MGPERKTENASRKLAEARGCLLLKLDTLTGIPDRALLAPGGKIVFVEFKAPGKKPSKIQQHRHAELRALGFQVEVIDSVADFEALLNSVAPS